MELDLKHLEKLIKPVAYYKVKARKLKDLCNVLINKFNGVIPRDRETLLSLPGVGFKTADVVLCYGFDEEIIPVDTHVSRISKRLGLIPGNAKKYEEIRERLEAVIPTKFKHIINLAFIQLGKEFCYPKKPKCSNCPILKYCRYGNLRRVKVCREYKGGNNED